MRRRTWLALAGAGAGALAYAKRRRATPQPPARLHGRATPHLGAIARTGRLARNVEAARIGGRAGGAYAMHRARSVFASADQRQVLEAAFQLRTAEQVAEALGHMKGAMMKVGQMLSYLDEGLPEPFRMALAQLQQDAPPMSPELSAQMVEQELGKAPDDLFEEWDPLPIAAASIGQVHRAITREGTAVAVKVQYPGVDDAIRADLANLPLFFGGLGMMFPGLEPGPIVAEVRTRLLEELDYANEAANQRLFADYWRDHPFIHVPDVLSEYSTARVLTTELAEGARFSDAEQWSQEERNLAAEAIFRFVFNSMYRMKAFNGDPHPGNYLFRPGGQVTFLDFGLIKHFDDEDVRIFEDMIRAIVLEEDPRQARIAIERAGILPASAPIDDQHVFEYFSFFYRGASPTSDAYDAEYTAEMSRRYFDLTGPYADVMRAANVPARMVLIQRINLGLFAILARLRPAVEFPPIAREIWPFVSDPPSTELGRAEAAWRARRAAVHA